jgi:carbamoylphosphate synthase large subunit
MTNQVLVEMSLLGWKEFELEVRTELSLTLTLTLT